MIARYGALARPVPTPVRAGAREALAETLACRRQLLAEITARSQQPAQLRTARLASMEMVEIGSAWRAGAPSTRPA